MANHFEQLTPEYKKRIGYIEGRPDLFETRIFSIKPGNTTVEKKHEMLVISRDPGPANTLAPVVRRLNNENINITALADGRAIEIFKKEFDGEDITPDTTPLAADSKIGKPDLVLMNTATSEFGMDTYTAATYPEIPQVLVEDYYTSSFSHLQHCIDRKLELPKKICVMDEGARDLMVERFPELADRIVVTGQPAFDRFAKEDTGHVAQATRSKLGIQQGEKLISYMSTGNDVERLQSVIEQLRGQSGDFKFVFRRHPRDNVSYEVYEQMLTDAGFSAIDTQQYATDEIGAASDLILTSWSTEGLHGIYRRKPTVHITDSRFGDIPKTLSLPLVPVRLGASVEIDEMEKLSGAVADLLDEKSPTNQALQENMEKYYPKDGKNAERVGDVVRTILNETNL